MNETAQTTLDQIAAGLAFFVIGACLLLWIRKLKWGPIEHRDVLPPEVLPWSRNWLDFMIVFWACIMVYLAVILMVIRFVFPIGFDPVVEAEGGYEPSWYTIIYSSSIQLAMLVTVVGAKFSYQIRFFNQPTVGSSPLIAMDRLIRYMPVLWIAAAVALWLNRQLGISSGEQEAVTMLQRIDNPWKFLAMAFLAVGAAPILEEVFFRGILLRFLVGYANRHVALVVSSVLFAALHFNADSMIPIAILGFLLGKVYLETGDLRSAIWMHIFFNTQSVFVIAIDRWIQ